MTITLERPAKNAATSTAVPAGGQEGDLFFPNLERQQRDQDKWDECIRSLVALRAYEDDWDGEGADAPALQNIGRAIQYVQLLRRRLPAIPAPSAAPGVSGEVLLTWRQGGYSLQADIEKPDQFEWMLMDAEGSATHWADGGELATLMEFLSIGDAAGEQLRCLIGRLITGRSREADANPAKAPELTEDDFIPGVEVHWVPDVPPKVIAHVRGKIVGYRPVRHDSALTDAEIANLMADDDDE